MGREFRGDLVGMYSGPWTKLQAGGAVKGLEDIFSGKNRFVVSKSSNIPERGAWKLRDWFAAILG